MTKTESVFPVSKIKPLAAPNLHETVIGFLSENGGFKGKNILDAGAGEGAFCSQLRFFGAKVEACDLNPLQFKAEKIECKKADLNGKIPYRNDSFDYVVSLEVIEHLENPHNFMSELKRVVKKDGLVIISTPNVAHISSRICYLLFGSFVYFWPARYRKFNHHINPLFRWEMEEMIVNLGMNIKNILYNEGKLAPLFMPFYQNRMIYFGSPISCNYLPKNNLFGENIIIVAQK